MSSTRHGPTISYRLESVLDEKLREEAAQQGLSPGVLTQRLVNSVLQDEVRMELLAALEELREETASLRSDVRTTLTLLLELARTSGTSAPWADIEQFIQKKLRGP